jgi:hypothetical protein
VSEQQTETKVPDGRGTDRTQEGVCALATRGRTLRCPHHVVIKQPAWRIAFDTFEAGTFERLEN